jgi:hypothetical protein
MENGKLKMGGQWAVAVGSLSGQWQWQFAVNNFWQLYTGTEYSLLVLGFGFE